MDRLLTRTTITTSWTHTGEYELLRRRSPVTLGEGRRSTSSDTECSVETDKLLPAAGGGYTELLAVYSVIERTIHLSYWLIGITQAIVHPKIITLLSFTQTCMAFFLL